MNYLLSALAGYLLGSVSFSILLSRLRYRDDIRRHGSGNAGMTNTLRTYGKLPAVLVLVGDALKGTLAAWVGWKLGGHVGTMYVAGLFAVVGHMFPLYFRFKGGKGVATAAGVILGSCRPALLVLLAVFLLVVVLSRYVSLGSVTGAAFYPFFMLWYTRGTGYSPRPEVICAFLMAGLVIWAHRSNIGRLLAGTESKLGARKPGQA